MLLGISSVGFSPPSDKSLARDTSIYSWVLVAMSICAVIVIISSLNRVRKLLKSTYEKCKKSREKGGKSPIKSNQVAPTSIVPGPGDTKPTVTPAATAAATTPARPRAEESRTEYSLGHTLNSMASRSDETNVHEHSESQYSQYSIGDGEQFEELGEAEKKIQEEIIINEIEDRKEQEQKEKEKGKEKESDKDNSDADKSTDSSSNPPTVAPLAPSPDSSPHPTAPSILPSPTTAGSVEMTSLLPSQYDSSSLPGDLLVPPPSITTPTPTTPLPVTQTLAPPSSSTNVSTSSSPSPSPSPLVPVPDPNLASPARPLVIGPTSRISTIQSNVSYFVFFFSSYYDPHAIT